MLRKSEIERLIRSVQKELEGAGLRISELTVMDGKVIKELEKKDVGSTLRASRKPHFKSHANYTGLRLGSNEIGIIYGIKIVGPDE